MITGLYETHVQVTDLEKATQFYTEVLGLTFAHRDATRPIVFLWIGEGKEYMLGLWETKEGFQPRHFAFRSSTEDILQHAEKYLTDRSLQPYNFLKNGGTQPMVFAWMPALAIYFKDPDGNQLEFISILEGDGKPELGVISYEEWLKTVNV
ncbi:Glyoxalase/Bleomycin resistance protein/Dioxygenase superfamily protein [Filimonas lacunae]|uniref:Glyoxalase/Bleomycin resistance protein/Dioxygenase superfamily protein n=1 Tax=Filimonas lacunae TaxID=477680 RepID=A0A173MQH5_9BACT|nr:VOC family protein [Filimonas lacunae]BAV09699.1 glyoxalase family protein [Filimonas lacunae]SIS77494.1 Glyoxalase/Bleomycin resistance protein/Dioxygenase superfamily protein [Filimonas lacunae]